MNGIQTEKPHTDGAGPHKVDQLAGQIDYSNTNKPQPQKQGRTFQIILTLWSLAAIVTAWCPK